MESANHTPSIPEVLDDLLNQYKGEQKAQEYYDRILAAKPIQHKAEIQKEEDEHLPPKTRAEKLSAFAMIEEYLYRWYEFRFNTVQMEAEMRPRGTEKPWKAAYLPDLFCELQRTGFNRATELWIKNLLRSNRIPRFDPIQAYFQQLTPWTEKEGDHITYLLQHLQLADPVDQDRLLTQGKKWIVRSVATAFRDKYVNKQIFTLVGEAQNMGKTSFLRWLCPPDLDAYYTENITFDKDGEIALGNNFIGNLDELAGLQKVEMAHLKQVVSKDRIKVRPPYEPKAIERKRLINFTASTNQTQFLTDETGSARWLVFHLIGIDFDYRLRINPDRLWAQAYSLFQDGFQYEMTVEEMRENERANQGTYSESAEYLLVAELLEKPSNGHESVFLTTTEILALINKVRETARLMSTKAMGAALKRHGFKKISKRLKPGGDPISCYEVANTPYLQFHLQKPASSTYKEESN